jgi:hypothetical protein
MKICRNSKRQNPSGSLNLYDKIQNSWNSARKSKRRSGVNGISLDSAFNQLMKWQCATVPTSY